MKHPNMHHQVLVTFARLFDYALFYLFGVIISLFSPVYVDPVHYIIFVILIPFLWPFIETFLIRNFRFTPGMHIFGLRMHTKLRFPIAYKRALWIEKKPADIEKTRGYIHVLVGLGIGAGILGLAIMLPSLFRFVSGGAGAATIESWVHYKPSDANFSIDFPEKPFKQEKELDLTAVAPKTIIPYSEYKSFGVEDPSIYYSVSFIRLPLKIRFYGDNLILKTSLNLIPENGPGVKVASSNTLIYQKYSALNFVLHSGDITTRGRLLLANGTLYKLVVDYPRGTPETEHHADEFLNTFHVTR